MSKVSIYLNFMGKTEEAFNFYKTVFNTDFSVPITRMSDAPVQPGQPELLENEKNMVMHVALPIVGGIEIMGTDMLASMGHKLEIGNNMSINLEIDAKDETDRIFGLLSDGGTDIMPMANMFWGAYFGTCRDKYGISWMFNCATKTE